MDVFAQITGEKSMFSSLNCRISSHCFAWALPSNIFINIWWTRLCSWVFLAFVVFVFVSNGHCESFLLSWIELDLLLLGTLSKKKPILFGNFSQTSVGCIAKDLKERRLKRKNYVAGLDHLHLLPSGCQSQQKTKRLVAQPGVHRRLY